MADGHVLRLSDLLDHAPLGLQLVSQADASVRIRGAHAIEIEHPGRWLQPGAAMLTTGLRFVGLPPGSGGESELIEELADGDAAALLFGIGVHFDAVPRPLIAAANARNFPLVTIPGEVPFFEVEQFVNQALYSSDAFPVRRQLLLQNDLLQALADPQPIHALVARLAGLVKGTAVIYEDTGRQVAAVGEGPTRLMWSEIRTRSAARQSFTVGRWHVIARPVVVRGAGYWIALSSRRASTLEDVGDALLESAQRIFAAVGGARVIGETQVRAESAAILRQLADGVTTEEEKRLWERLKGYRFPPRHPVRFFAATPRREDAVAGAGPAVASGPQEIDALLATLHDEAQLSGLPVLLHSEGSLDAAPGTPVTPGSETVLRGLVGGGAPLDDWLETLTTTHHVGLSESFTDLVSARAHLQDAVRAGHVAVRRGGFAGDQERGTLVRFEDVDLATWLISSRSADETAAKASQQLAGLLDRADLVETVTTYLEQGLDIIATANALYLHPNSVRYRLKKVEEILEAPMTSPTIIANLYLAFHNRLAPH